MSIDCIIIEDEPLAIERAKEYIGKLAFLNLAGTFDNALDALDFINTNRVDLIFLDINLGVVSGIQFLESTRLNNEVILTTAYPEYALKGFDLKVADYLLKPYTFDRFLQAVNRVRANLSKGQPSNERDFIFIKTAYRLEKIAFEDILYIEGMRDYRKIVTAAKPILTLQTFGQLEEEFPSATICRVHKSYMVALNKISSVEKDRIRIGDKYIPISETYKKSFFDLIANK
ncbi:MAG TPA: LytTR family DNA-binding domain-containing protein [Flavisolibacter sp.]|nr:LytTR family DNA-binding domain-containing protein [Flavisolibacter sp.]